MRHVWAKPGLVSGAHILPVSALGSTDHATNGLALCENHHRAFDSHRIWVHPEKRIIKIHPNILKHANKDPRSKNFVETMFKELAQPTSEALLPPQRNFDERYAYYEDFYEWVA
jgi:predicted restriction endonuclease